MTGPPTQERKRPIGRDAALAACDGFLDAIALGSAVLVLAGEPGIGKTTVWKEICSRAAERASPARMAA